MRAESIRTPVYRFEQFSLDPADERLSGPGGPVRIGNKAFRVLLMLIEQQGRLLTKEALFSSVWDGTIVSESALTSVIKELRRALDDNDRPPRLIEAVYGRGYRFLAPVSSGDPSPAQPEAKASDRDGAGPDPGGPPLVLVSAFEDEAVRGRHPYLAAAMREEVLSGLARFREIRLIADPRSEREAGAGLGHASPRDYQLTGALIPDGDDVKIIARAKRLHDGRVVWAQSLSLADTGTAKGVETIVRRIVGAALPAVDEDMFNGLPIESDAFYDRYLIAKRRSLTARNFEEARSAAAALERLIAERPDFALAYPPLVRLYNTDFGYTGLGYTGPIERARALELARAGLAADRGNVHAYTVLAFCRLWHDERDLALDCLQQALALNPYNHVRFQEVATGMMYIGDLPMARSLLERARELNPLPDDDVYEDNGRLDLLEGRYESGRQALKSIVHGSIWAELYLSLCEIALGDPAGPKRLHGWRSRVEANWLAPKPPDAAEIAAWIRSHHPVPAAVGAHLLVDAEAALQRDG